MGTGSSACRDSLQGLWGRAASLPDGQHLASATTCPSRSWGAAVGQRHAAPVRHRQGAGATPRRLPPPQPQPVRRRSASCSVAGGRAGAACAARPLSGTGEAARRGRGRPAQVGARVLCGAARGAAGVVPAARPLPPLVQLWRSLPAPFPRPLRAASPAGSGAPGCFAPRSPSPPPLAAPPGSGLVAAEAAPCGTR